MRPKALRPDTTTEYPSLGACQNEFKLLRNFGHQQAMSLFKGITGDGVNFLGARTACQAARDIPAHGIKKDGMRRLAVRDRTLAACGQSETVDHLTLVPYIAHQGSSPKLLESKPQRSTLSRLPRAIPAAGSKRGLGRQALGEASGRHLKQKRITRHEQPDRTRYVF